MVVSSCNSPPLANYLPPLGFPLSQCAGADGCPLSQSSPAPPTPQSCLSLHCPSPQQRTQQSPRSVCDVIMTSSSLWQVLEMCREAAGSGGEGRFLSSTLGELDSALHGGLPRGTVTEVSPSPPVPPNSALIGTGRGPSRMWQDSALPDCRRDDRSTSDMRWVWSGCGLYRHRSHLLRHQASEGSIHGNTRQLLTPLR